MEGCDVFSFELWPKPSGHALKPQMMVVSDVDDVFVPLPYDLLVNLSESRSVVESMFQDNVNVESAFGPALKALLMLMEFPRVWLCIYFAITYVYVCAFADQPWRKIVNFSKHTAISWCWSLKVGDDLRVYGSNKEHLLRLPGDPFYKQMAAEFTKFQIWVDVYAFSDKYTDIASLVAERSHDQRLQHQSHLDPQQS
ncbi:hypothetical protein FF1_006708 [Malus domestica]